MERELKTIKLSNCEVKIITFLTWGEKEKGSLENVGASMAELDNTGLKGMKGNPLLELKFQRSEIAVKEVKQGEAVTSFSREWMENLSSDDGDTLYTEIENVFTKKK